MQSTGICSNQRARESWRVHLVFPFYLQAAVIERDHSVQYPSRVGEARQHVWPAVVSVDNEDVVDARAAILAVICDPVYAGHCDNDTKQRDISNSSGGRAFAVPRIASKPRQITAEIRPSGMTEGVMK